MEYKVIEIDGDNVEDFSDFIDEDLAEQMDREFYRGIGAKNDKDEPCGAMVFELKDSESEEDTKSRIRMLNAVDEDAKNAIFTEYANVVSEEEVMESFYESPDKDLCQYLENNGFSLSATESKDLVITVEEIKKIAMLLKGKKAPAYIESLSEASVLQYRRFVKECLFKGYKGLMDDLAYIPKNWYETEVSSCVITDDEVNGVFLIKKSASGSLYTMLFTAFGADYQRNLGLMMAYTAQKILELYPEDVKVVVRRHNAVVQKLTDKFFAGSKGKDVFSGNRSEG